MKQPSLLFEKKSLSVVGSPTEETMDELSL